MKAVLQTEETIVKRVATSKKQTSGNVYLPRAWAGRLVAIIPLSFDFEEEGETELVKILKEQMIGGRYKK
jgi:hypothetical protein